MKIDSLDELDKLIDLCRKKGISNIEVDGVKFEMGDPPPSNYKKRQGRAEKQPETRQYSEEDILFWSSGAQPQPMGAVNE